MELRSVHFPMSEIHHLRFLHSRTSEIHLQGQGLRSRHFRPLEILPPALDLRPSRLRTLAMHVLVTELWFRHSPRPAIQFPPTRRSLSHFLPLATRLLPTRRRRASPQASIHTRSPILKCGGLSMRSAGPRLLRPMWPTKISIRVQKSRSSPIGNPSSRSPCRHPLSKWHIGLNRLRWETFSCSHARRLAAAWFPKTSVAITQSGFRLINLRPLSCFVLSHVLGANRCPVRIKFAFA
jgi:hypothetical protein